MRRNFMIPHDEIMRVLAERVLHDHPSLDPDKTTFVLIMKRVPPWNPIAKATLLVKSGDDDNRDKRKLPWWKRLGTLNPLKA